MRPQIQVEYQASILRDITQWVDSVQGINLGQGVCQTPVPELLIEAIKDAVESGNNRYAPPLGVEELRQQVAAKLQRDNQMSVDSSCVAITHGSTGAFEALCQAFLTEGDEVILFRPFYPYHRKAVEARGAQVRIVELWAPNWDYKDEDLEQAFSPRTKMVVVCTPNNPTGKIFSRDELLKIGKLCQKHQSLLVSDEVYEYMCYDGLKHTSPGSIGEISDQVITMGSFSKTFSITGWRVGYLVAPREWMPALGTLLDRTYVCSPTPAQWAVAQGLQKLDPSYYQELSELYQGKRDLITQILTDSGFDCLPVQGAYYLLATPPKTWREGRSAVELIEKMVYTTGIGAVPAFEFLDAKGAPERQESWLRFCYSQPQDRLLAVAKRLELWK